MKSICTGVSVTSLGVAAGQKKKQRHNGCRPNLRFGIAPTPEIIRPSTCQQILQSILRCILVERGVCHAVSCPDRSLVIEGHLQQHQLNRDHQACLHEQCCVVVCAEPVEDPGEVLVNAPIRRSLFLVQGFLLENRGQEHDQGNIQRKPFARFPSVDGSNLVGIGRDRG